MNLEKLVTNNDSAVFDTELNVLGGLAGIDFLNQTANIMDSEGDIVVAKLENLIQLEVVGTMNGEPVLNGDVIASPSGKYEIELQEDGKLAVYLLDKNLERSVKGESFDADKLESMATYAVLEGHILELKAQVETVDFNIRVLRQFIDGETVYYYACNNKETEEVDLIKVIYVGHFLLEEEDYERTTLSHENYLSLIKEEGFKEVSPQELANYVTGMSYGNKPKTSLDTKVKDEQNEVEIDDENFCSECGKHEDDCNDCDNWKL